MGRKLHFQILKVIPTLQFCGSKDLPTNPIPSSHRPSRHVSSALYSSEAFQWLEEEKWHVLSKVRHVAPRHKIDEENRGGKKKRRVVMHNKSSSSSSLGESPARLSVFKKLIPCALEGKVKESFAVVKKSKDPYEDFKRSMVEMILEKQIFDDTELEQLLLCFLSLNSRLYHGLIVEAFTEIWEAMFCTFSPMN